MFPAAQNIQVVFMQVFLRLVFFNKYVDVDEVLLLGQWVLLFWNYTNIKFYIPR